MRARNYCYLYNDNADNPMLWSVIGKPSAAEIYDSRAGND